MSIDDSHADRIAGLSDKIMALPSERRAAAIDALTLEDKYALSKIFDQKAAWHHEQAEAHREQAERELGDQEGGK